jgi:uncharacterized protein
MSNDTSTPGNFCWFELTTTDGEAAKQFYTSLFGWTGVDMPGGPDMVYTMLKLGDKDAAALYQMSKEQQGQGIPPNWLTYVSVASADDSAKKAEQLGGKIFMAPFDVMDVGRMALIQDPTGAMIATWEGRRHKGAGVTGEPNSFCWGELVTTDIQTAGDFYKGLFNWATKGTDMGPETYTEFLNNDVPVGGMMKITEQMAGVPPHWGVYFSVTDCDATVEKAVGLGGSVVMPPMDIPNVGRFAVIKDPQGAVFSVIKLQQRS